MSAPDRNSLWGKGLKQLSGLLMTNDHFPFAPDSAKFYIYKTKNTSHE